MVRADATGGSYSDRAAARADWVEPGGGTGSSCVPDPPASSRCRDGDAAPTTPRDRGGRPDAASCSAARTHPIGSMVLPATSPARPADRLRPAAVPARSTVPADLRSPPPEKGSVHVPEPRQAVRRPRAAPASRSCWSTRSSSAAGSTRPGRARRSCPELPIGSASDQRAVPRRRRRSSARSTCRQLPPALLLPPSGIIDRRTPAAGTGQLEPSTAGGVGLLWHHLIYAYLIESTGAFEVFAEVVRRLVAGETLGTLSHGRRAAGCGRPRSCSSATRRCSRSPASVSEARPHARVTRRNAYWRMFGFDLPHPLPRVAGARRRAAAGLEGARRAGRQHRLPGQVDRAAAAGLARAGELPEHVGQPTRPTPSYVALPVRGAQGHAEQPAPRRAAGPRGVRARHGAELVPPDPADRHARSCATSRPRRPARPTGWR